MNTAVLQAPTDVRIGPSWSGQLRALVRRSLRKTVRDPKLLMFSTMMPFAMLVLFSQVFRSIADGPDFLPGVAYIDFLAPRAPCRVYGHGRHELRSCDRR